MVARVVNAEHTCACRRQVFGKGSGQIALHWAAESNHTDIVRFLSDVSLLSVAAVDERGRTARDAAASELAFDAGNVLSQAADVQLTCIRLVASREYAAALPAPPLR
ncbi:ankyrin repeat domain-containing protein [archaeon]|nr:MAG: ankyrin repeat domain-containing protein [archaeon]